MPLRATYRYILCKAGNPQEHAKVAIKIMLERAGLFSFFDGILLYVNQRDLEESVNEVKKGNPNHTSDSQFLYVGYNEGWYKKAFKWLGEEFPQLETVSIPKSARNGNEGLGAQMVMQGEIRKKCGL